MALILISVENGVVAVAVETVGVVAVILISVETGGVVAVIVISV